MFEIPFYFQDYIRVGNSIWFASGDYNGLYKYNLEEKRTERIAVFQYEPFYQSGLFVKMCQYKNKLIFVPQCSKRIYVFNIDNTLLTDINIPNLTDELKAPYFCEAVVYGEHLYMMGAKYPGILKIDLENYTVEIIDHWIQKLKDDVKLDMSGIFLGMKGVSESNRFLIPCYQCNRVLEFNMDTEEYCFHEVGNVGNKYARMTKAGNVFALITHNDKDVCSAVFWDFSEDSSREVQLNIQAYADREIIGYLGDIWVLSFVTNEICRIRVRDGEIHRYSVPGVTTTAIVCVKVINSELFFCDYITQAWYKINNWSEIEKVGACIKDCLTSEEIKQMMINDKLPDYYLQEYRSYPVEVWIDKVAKQGFNEKCRSIQNAGKLIFECLR